MNLISLKKAVIEIRQACAGVEGGQRSPFFFVVGAGISYPSIPLAAELVRQFEQKARGHGHDDEPQSSAPIDKYAHWFQAAYPQRIDRQRFLRQVIENRAITDANLRLAHLLLKRTIANLVVTPNFDDFLTRSLQLFGKRHIICDHPRTVERIDPEEDDVQILHVHGTYSFYDCCNLRDEIKAQAERSSATYTMGSLLDQVLDSRRAPLVVGYSGWEGDAIMTALHKRLRRGPLPRKIYWFCYKRAEVGQLPAWLRARGRAGEDDVCFVVPEEEDVSGEPVSRAAAAEMKVRPDASRGERGLDAKEVFDKLIEAFKPGDPG